MKTLYKFILPLLVTVIIASCEKDIKVKTPEVKEGLTLFSNTETGAPMAVAIGKSMSVLKYNGKQEFLVTNATVKLYENGQYLETLIYNQDLKQYVSTALIQPGKRYKLTVDAPGYAGIEAEAESPVAVVLTNVRVADTLINSSGGTSSDYVGITIKFDDPGTTSDYYQLNYYSAMQVAQNEFSTSYECLNITDPSFEEKQQEGPFGGDDDCKSGDIIFTDALFNGKNKKLIVTINPYSTLPVSVGPGDSVYAVLKLYHISTDRFKYINSYNKAQESDGNPFAEPVNVYTNVKNGYGIFSITQPVTIKIKR